VAPAPLPAAAGAADVLRHGVQEGHRDVEERASKRRKV
jgi:hypothetical protein